MSNTRPNRNSAVDVTATRPFRLVIPPVYRYMQKEFASALMERGELRLSCIKTFQAHKDEARGDILEGSAHLLTRSGNWTFMSSVSVGDSSYIICGSHILSQDIQKQFSGADAVIEIFDPANFALAVSNQLAGFINGVSSHCIYTDRQTIERAIDEDVLAKVIKDDGTSIAINDMMAAGNAIAQEDANFIKDRKFSPQAEYRFVWNVDREVTEHIDIKIPGISFCCREVNL